MDELMQVMAIGILQEAEDRFHPNVRRNPRDPFQQLNERQFINTFRLSKDLCNYLIERISPYIVHQRRNTDLDVRTKILAALNFYACGSYQLSVGANKYLDISRSSVSKSIHEVTEALNHRDIFNGWIQFPNNFQKLNTARERFSAQHGMPGVVGCLDCTHVAIFPPHIDDPEQPEYIYVNRKNYHSINVQLVCDRDLKILDINARFPGSTNDALIWNQSQVQAVMRNLHRAGHTDYYLLGDSGYPLRTWVLTPFSEVQPNSPEHVYNAAHKRTRAKIECCNGTLKGRFRCLLKHRVLHYKPDIACKIINACAVLHNMCIEYNVPEPDNIYNIREGDLGIIDEHYVDNEDENATRRVNPELADGRKARFRVARSLRP